MALDGLFLSKLLNEFSFLEGGRIQKINQVGKSAFLFVIHKGGNQKLFVSLDRNEYRICLTDKEYQSPLEPTNFCMVLRKHLEGGIIKSIEQNGLDRIVTFKITKLNEFGDNREKNLILEFMGKNSNLIITDEKLIIIDALKKIGVSESGKTILPHSEYEYNPLIKLNILRESNEEIVEAYNKVANYKDITDLFEGFSPSLAKYIITSIAPIKEIEGLKDIKVNPVIYQSGEKKDFYFMPLSSSYTKYSSLSNLLEEYYYLSTISNLVSEKSNNLKTHIKHTITKLENKVIKLNCDLDEANKKDIWQKYGMLITNNLYLINPLEHLEEITLFDYEANTNITIPLDNKVSVKENSNRFFNKYQKGKKAISYINEQLEITKDEIAYLEIILVQIENASLKDIEQIKDELVANHYLKNASNKKAKKKEKIELQAFYTSNETMILVGKNNIQNEYLTHTVSKPNYYWFHVKDAPGSHVVVIKDDDLNEEEIRSAANLAAYYSKFQSSSSVPVCYTKVRNIKKIPGKKNCFVTYSNEKTIYIDPDIKLIDIMKKKA